MSDGPHLLIDEKDFRLVRIVDGNRVTYMLEVEDGCDALGVQRWRTFDTRGSKHLNQIFGYLIRVATKQHGLSEPEGERDRAENI